jgi:hypothetical protein
MFRMSPGSTVRLMVRCLKYEEKIIKVLVPNEFSYVQKNLSSSSQCSGSGLDFGAMRSQIRILISSVVDLDPETPV